MERLNKKKLLLLTLLIWVLFLLVSAEILLFTAFDHECLGVNCPICTQAVTIKNFLQVLLLASIVFLLVNLLSYSAKIVFCYLEPHFSYLTPVILKTRFNS